MIHYIIHLCTTQIIKMMASPRKGPVMLKFNVFFVVSLNKLLRQQSNFQWFETPWRLCDVTVMHYIYVASLCLCCYKEL